MKRLPLLAFLAALLTLAGLLAGCGSSSSSSSGPSSHPPPVASTPASSAAGAPSSGATIQVAMKNIAFIPKVAQAKVGQTVQWVNDDAPAHNVTYVGGPKFTSSSLMPPGAKFSVKLTQPGTIRYVCTIHPGMTGTIVVTK